MCSTKITFPTFTLGLNANSLCPVIRKEIIKDIPEVVSIDYPSHSSSLSQTGQNQLVMIIDFFLPVRI